VNPYLRDVTLIDWCTFLSWLLHTKDGFAARTLTGYQCCSHHLEVVPDGGHAAHFIFWSKQPLVTWLLSDIFIRCFYCAMKLFWLEKLLEKSYLYTQKLLRLTSLLSYSVTLILWRYEPVLFGFFQQKEGTNQAGPSPWWYVNYLAQQQMQSTHRCPGQPELLARLQHNFLEELRADPHESSLPAGQRWEGETCTSMWSYCSTVRFQRRQQTPDWCTGESTLFLPLTEEMSFPRQLDKYQDLSGK